MAKWPLYKGWLLNPLEEEDGDKKKYSSQGGLTSNGFAPLCQKERNYRLLQAVQIYSFYWYGAFNEMTIWCEDNYK